MNKRLLGIVAILVILIGGGVAMKSIFTGEEIPKDNSSISSKDRDNELKIETELAKKIISEYDGVKKIEFSNWGHSEKTGIYSKMATINNEDQISYSFDDNKSINSLRGYVTDDDMYVIKRKELLNIGKIDLSKCSITEVKSSF
ncbi:hypothetical protein DIY14_01645 [Streptococcus iniae]|uniref:hypothetical protein n=1 Tax=Streptococcus iniae TaxID=1346 RepID=UPI000EF73BB0|nr:hypothetical protein [Streptococcus iniae]RLU29208.1 hypothetical protein DIY15_01640 [Streptococcus iniae]RLU33493.1 hypothetical protein DIY14_01645 [Streptococcus iniae]RLV31203.1 hypothetical protein DIX49_10035 [Streptococcus iniae]